MGYTYDTAAQALGMSRSGYAHLLASTDPVTGHPKNIDRRTALACSALKFGLIEYSSDC